MTNILDHCPFSIGQGVFTPTQVSPSIYDSRNRRRLSPAKGGGGRLQKNKKH